MKTMNLIIVIKIFWNKSQRKRTEREIRKLTKFLSTKGINITNLFTTSK